MIKLKNATNRDENDEAAPGMANGGERVETGTASRWKETETATASENETKNEAKTDDKQAEKR